MLSHLSTMDKFLSKFNQAPSVKQKATTDAQPAKRQEKPRCFSTKWLVDDNGFKREWLYYDEDIMSFEPTPAVNLWLEDSAKKGKSGGHNTRGVTRERMQLSMRLKN